MFFSLRGKPAPLTPDGSFRPRRFTADLKFPHQLGFAPLSLLMEGRAGEPRACLNSGRVFSWSPCWPRFWGLGLWQKAWNYFLDLFRHWLILSTSVRDAPCRRLWRWLPSSSPAYLFWGSFLLVLAPHLSGKSPPPFLLRSHHVL